MWSFCSSGAPCFSLDNPSNLYEVLLAYLLKPTQPSSTGWAACGELWGIGPDLGAGMSASCTVGPAVHQHSIMHCGTISPGTDIIELTGGAAPLHQESCGGWWKDDARGSFLGRTLLSRPNKVGLKCPSGSTSVLPFTKGFFDFSEIWYVGRVRWVMHDGMQYDPMEGEGHEPFKVGKPSIFKC